MQAIRHDPTLWQFLENLQHIFATFTAAACSLLHLNSLRLRPQFLAFAKTLNKRQPQAVIKTNI
jgi:hypothetical protein